ncbi:MAG: hypothetical protein HYV07_32595 [Deltaproteobacteria bacterium]|nr:hypothetical protein [Deltaproteobacteria bacterium]
MKALFGILLVLFVAETYGVYGRAQADRLVVSCTMPLGPLCFAWKESPLGRMLGPAPSKELEAKLLNAKREWEGAFEEKVAKRLESHEGIDDLVTDARKKAQEALEGVGKTMGKLSKEASDPALAERARGAIEAMGQGAEEVLSKTGELIGGKELVVEGPATERDAGAAPDASAAPASRPLKPVELD